MVLGRWSGPGTQEEAGPGPTVHLPLLSFSPKAFPNLPLNILPSRDHSKCHFWLEISYIVSRASRFPSTARAGGAPGSRQGSRAAGQGTMFCVCHCLTCRKSPVYPEQSHPRAGAPT